MIKFHLAKAIKFEAASKINGTQNQCNQLNESKPKNNKIERKKNFDELFMHLDGIFNPLT